VAPTRGPLWAKMKRLYSGYGGRSVGRSRQKTYQPTSSCNSGT
jgi:hypothetical protein